MPGITSRTNRADTFDDLDSIPARDHDPEDDLPEDESDREGPDVDGIDAVTVREHYEPVSKSKLRQCDERPLGSGYEGSRIDRRNLGAGEPEHDPLDGYGSDEISDDDISRSEDDEDIEDDDSHSASALESMDSGEDECGTEDTSLSDEEHDDRAELRQLMNQGRASVTTSIAEATRADAEKGRAVQQQRKAFDALLNSRIKMQQALVTTNTMPTLNAPEQGPPVEPVEAAETALTQLWSTLDDLRLSLAKTRTGEKRKRFEAEPDTSSTTMWAHMQSLEQSERVYRRKVLQNWSTRTQSASAKPTSGRLNQAVRQTTFVDVLDEQLANPERLVKRTRMPRSAAPIQASQRITESADIFDDADFYGVMLKELLEQRNVDAASQASSKMVAEQWQAARQIKTKREVDTKASKGRKMRFTVHEKLQNFMAPEDRGSWGERQVEELFGSLLGKRIAAAEGAGDIEDGEQGEEAALRLFRS